MKPTEDLDCENSTDGPHNQETESRASKRNETSDRNEDQIERSLSAERLPVVRREGKKGKDPAPASPGRRGGLRHGRPSCCLQGNRQPGQVSEEKERQKDGASQQEPPSGVAAPDIGRESVLGEKRGRDYAEHERREIEGIRGRETGEPEC